MRQQTLIALAIAVVLGLVAVFLANSYLSRGDQQNEAQTSTSKIAVAAVPLDYGIDLSPDKVKFVDYPSASVPAGSFSTYEQLVPAGKRRVVLRPMTMNEPILATKLAGEGLGPSIAYLLPDGMRAAAVRVNDVSGVAGFIQPNDSVDVLVTRTIPGADNRQVTDILIQNAKVIAIDQNAQTADGKPVVARTPTLEVVPTAAQKLALGQQVGTLSLVLRKPGLEQDSTVRTVSLSDLRYSYYGTAPATPANVSQARPRMTVAVQRRPARPARVATAPSRTTKNVEVVRGTQGSNYEVGGYGS